MPVVQRSEFALALNQVATERGVDVAVVMDTVKNAIIAAYRKDHPGIELEEYTATLNPNTGEARILHKEKDVTPPGFGRIAAQTAKQVILQKIREKEREAIVTDYRARVGTIVNAMVLKFAGPNVILDIGKAEGIMPPPDQIQNEKYHLNQRLAVYISDIREGTKGEEIIVSRSHIGLLEGLFKREVPEVAQGSVEIKAIAREGGVRAKVAVASSQSGIDPVGSCVGQKGVRVQAIIQELGGIEKIDIIQWQENIKNYIVQALSPAKNIKIELDDKEKVANVKVPKEELSLAIGREGQNVRLASKLVGYRIEIDADEEAETAVEASETEEEKGTVSNAAAAEEKKVVKAKKATKKAKKEESEIEEEAPQEEVVEETQEKVEEEKAAESN